MRTFKEHHGVSGLEETSNSSSSVGKTFGKYVTTFPFFFLNCSLVQELLGIQHCIVQDM